jgi:hypothetical protein
MSRLVSSFFGCLTSDFDVPSKRPGANSKKTDPKSRQIWLLLSKSRLSSQVSCLSLTVSSSHPLSQVVSRFDEVIDGKGAHMQRNWSKTLQKCFGLRRREIRLMSHVSCLMFRVTVPSNRFNVHRQDGAQVGSDLAVLCQLNHANRRRAARRPA